MDVKTTSALIVLGTGQDEVAAVGIMAARAVRSVQQFGINLYPHLELVTAQDNEVPQDKRPPALELQRQINRGALAIIHAKVPQSFRFFYAHALGQTYGPVRRLDASPEVCHA